MSRKQSSQKKIKLYSSASEEGIVKGGSLNPLFYLIDPKFALWYSQKGQQNPDLMRHLLTGSTNNWKQYPSFNQAPRCLPFPHEYRGSDGKCKSFAKPLPLWAIILMDPKKREEMGFNPRLFGQNVSIDRDDIFKHLLITEAFKGGEDVALLYTASKFINLDDTLKHTTGNAGQVADERQYVKARY